MAKQKVAKNEPDSVEPMVIALAEQLGTFLGRVQAKADGWLESETLRQQVGQIRDGATSLLEQVNQSSAAARKSAAKAGAVVRQSAAKAVAAVRPKAKAAKKAPAKVKARSGGTVDAPGKKHRKPPPQQKVDRRGSEPGKPMGQQGAKGRMQRGRG
jgi:hypothetical protein